MSVTWSGSTDFGGSFSGVGNFTWTIDTLVVPSGQAPIGSGAFLAVACAGKTAAGGDATLVFVDSAGTEHTLGDMGFTAWCLTQGLAQSFLLTGGLNAGGHLRIKGTSSAAETVTGSIAAFVWDGSAAASVGDLSNSTITISGPSPAFGGTGSSPQAGTVQGSSRFTFTAYWAVVNGIADSSPAAAAAFGGTGWSTVVTKVNATDPTINVGLGVYGVAPLPTSAQVSYSFSFSVASSVGFWKLWPIGHFTVASTGSRSWGTIVGD